MRSTGEASPRQLALRGGVQLYAMADGSGVLADAEAGEAHALNAAATRLLSSPGTSPGTWSEASLAAELRAGGASADVAAAQASGFLDGLRALGVLGEADG